VPSVLKAISGQIKSLTGSDRVQIDGQTIPSAHLRFGGANFADDAVFLKTGQTEAKRLENDFGLNDQSRVLEIGCGTGRLPIGILSTVGDIAVYRGVDVSQTAINWCKRHIQKRHPNFRFLHINVRNDRYNPKGRKELKDNVLPFDDKSFDVIYLYSVFSHLSEEDVNEYLAEFKRVLTPGGKVFVTLFVEDDVPSFEENPSDYKQEWKGALHCVRFEKNHFESLVRKHDLTIDTLHYGTETDGQSAYYLSS
jgi:ubiquinone/menaquinone biosynthesis C-methylase UbiE